VAGKTVRIDVGGAPEHIRDKWGSLNPVYGNADSLDDPATFASAPLADQIQCTPAFNGPLLPDTRGQEWHYISDVWRNGYDTFSFVQRFEADRAYVAMRVPYTPAYNERFLSDLQLRNSGASVLKVGKSKESRPLRMVKIVAPSEGAAARNPCVVIYAREHGNEQDSSWAAEGAIQFLLSESPDAREIRNRFTFLIIPILDPDGAAWGSYENMIQSFAIGQETPESIAYGRFFKQWVDDGNRLDLVLDLHNIESAEQPHLSCPTFSALSQECSRLHSVMVQQFRASAMYIVSPEPWFNRPHILDARLGWWLATYYGALVMPYELNSQEQHRHLSLGELREMGRQFVLGAVRYLDSEDGRRLRNRIDSTRTERLQRWNEYQTKLSGLNPVNAEIMCLYLAAQKGR
jgi:hypothetical protein